MYEVSCRRLGPLISITSRILQVLPGLFGLGPSVSSVSTWPLTVPSYLQSQSLAEQMKVPTYFFFWASYPTVMMLVMGAPKHSPLSSEMSQKPPTSLALSVPFIFTGGLPGSMSTSASVSHSPTNCLSHSCSFWGAGIFGGSCAHVAVPTASTAATIARTAGLRMASSSIRTEIEGRPSCAVASAGKGGKGNKPG